MRDEQHDFWRFTYMKGEFLISKEIQQGVYSRKVTILHYAYLFPLSS